MMMKKRFYKNVKQNNFFDITYDGKLGGCPWLMKSEQGFDVGSLLEEDFLTLKTKCQNEIKRKKEKRKEKMSLCKECSKKQECEAVALLYKLVIISYIMD